MSGNGRSSGRDSGRDWNVGTADNYRPLNVRDALTYLDQVKIQFSDHPDVYNRFLDVMKEFKGQVIDTPGVIDRVSTLFRDHPALIQGFNTFLPPGYRIECMQGPGNEGMITVTTPSGTVSQMAGQFSQTLQDSKPDEASLAGLSRSEAERAAAARADGRSNGAGAGGASSSASNLSQGPPPLGGGAGGFGSRAGPQTAVAPPSTSTRPAPQTATAAPSQIHMPPAQSQPPASSGPSTPSAAQFLSTGMGSNAAGSALTSAALAQSNAASYGSPANGGLHPSSRTAPAPQPLEFNHAITFVNKIKQRYSSEPDTYKQFLEILQTYQRETRDIAEVYAQVTKLFGTAPELIDEFKQFLPENGAPGFGGGGLGSLIGSATAPAPAQSSSQKKAGRDGKDAAVPKKRRGGPGDAKGSRKKPANKADSPEIEDDLTVPSTLPAAPQTLASPEEVAFFDKAKKFIDDKYTYHEFLKLINLFSQDMIDVKTLMERAELFIGQSPEVWALFKKICGLDDQDRIPPNPTSAQGGYGFGGMINVDNQVVENTPMLERIKPNLNSTKIKHYGPSYRKLPRSEVDLTCTGRDAMCWEVLNDEWVSHPTWAAEDAAPFVTHKKNAFEEALHKSEEERHEYDYHIEANLRTIAMLEPINNKVQTMDPDERAMFSVKNNMSAQSKSIYQRIIKKVYGKELGPEVIKAMYENPTVALPIVIERLKIKDDEWKKAQREWNRVWREQDAKNFYKALDHQGVQFKQNDKKTIATKSLINEAEARRREWTNVRNSLLHPKDLRARPQFEFDLADMEVVQDVLKLVISYLDRASNAMSPVDKDRIERHLRDFVPLLLVQDKNEFDAVFGEAEVEGEDDAASEASDGSASVLDDDDAASTVNGRSAKGGKKGANGVDLRKKLLKQVGEKESREQRGSTMTPGPEDETTAAADESTAAAAAGSRSAEGSPVTDIGGGAADRGETPVPVPDDPEAVAEAVEKDKADAEAGEQTWVHVEADEAKAAASSGSAGSAANGGDVAMDDDKDKGKKAAVVPRRVNFFANNHYYALIRLIQLLYARLVACKQMAASMASKKLQPINPLAIKLGLAEPDTQNFGVEDGENPAQHYYVQMLSLAEKLFENEVDVPTYEELLRLMFGVKAYTMFTLDRVVAAIIKQTQTILGDTKSQGLWALLQRDRLMETYSGRSQIAYRHSAENVLGSDENLYRVQWRPYSDTLTVQLLGREDPSIDDAGTAEEQYRLYVDSYSLMSATEGLAHRIDAPFLQRTLADSDELVADDEYESHSGLGLKFAMSSFRMFPIPGGEDYFHRKRKATNEDKETADAEAKGKKLKDWVESKLAEDKEAGSASAATTTHDDPASATTPAASGPAAVAAGP